MALAILIMYHPDGHQEQVELLKPTVRLGRADDNDIVVQHHTVSQHHAQLLCDADECQMLDLGSANGTFLTGMRLTPHVPQRLEDSALLQIGGIALTYHAPHKARAVGAAQGNAAASAATTLLPIGAAPPLPTGMPHSNLPAREHAGALPNATALTTNADDATLLLPVAQPPVPVVPAPAPTNTGSADETLHLPATAQPSVVASSAVRNVPPTNAGAPPPSSVVPHLPKRGWWQPPHLVAAAPAVPQGGRAARWLLELALVALLAIIAAGVWLLLPGTTTEPVVSGTPAANAEQRSGDADPSSATASPSPAASIAPTRDAPPASTVNAPPPPAEYVVATDGNQQLRVRDNPGETSNIVGALLPGTIVRVVDGLVVDGAYQWVRIESNSVSGWCIQEALRPR